MLHNRDFESKADNTVFCLGIIARKRLFLTDCGTVTMQYMYSRSQMMDASVLTRASGRVVELRLNRPDVGNALDLPLVEALLEALDNIDAEAVRYGRSGR